MLKYLKLLMLKYLKMFMLIYIVKDIQIFKNVYIYVQIFKKKIKIIKSVFIQKCLCSNI